MRALGGAFDDPTLFAPAPARRTEHQPLTEDQVLRVLVDELTPAIERAIAKITAQIVR